MFLVKVACQCCCCVEVMYQGKVGVGKWFVWDGVPMLKVESGSDDVLKIIGEDDT